MQPSVAGGSASDLERALDVRQLVARQRQIALGLVQHQVQEQALVVGHQTDQVVLVPQGDEDVFDASTQAQRLHGLELGVDHLGVSRCSQVQVDATARLGQAQAAAVVHQGDRQGTVNGQRRVHALLQVRTHIVAQ